MENLVLIDGNSLINRAFYAMPILSSKNGVFTNAVYGFMNMFFRMVGEIKPDYVAVAFDMKAPTFRHKLFAEYKGTRKPMPEELRPQIPLLKELLRTMNVAVFEKEGIEADDIIGTIAKRTKINTIIFTGDKDSFQLVDGETEVRFTKRGITETEIYNAQNFKDKVGINPVQIIDLKSLMGDSSDNIPGVKGVGEKTALTLIQTYGSLENLYLHVDDLKGKLKERIVENKETAELSKILATINTDCEIDADVEKMRFKLPFPDLARQKFIDLEFKSLSARNDLFENSTETVDKPQNQDETVSADTQNVKYQTRVSANVEQNAELDIKQEITLINEKPKEIIEPKSPDALVGKFAGKETAFVYYGKTLSVYCEGIEYAFSVREGLLDVGNSLTEILQAGKEIFTSAKRLIVYSKKELRHLLKVVGLELTCPCEDVSILKYLADFTGKDRNALDLITSYALNENAPACALVNVYEFLMRKLKSEKMEKLYYDVELPLADVLFDMEVAGFKIDCSALNAQGNAYKERLEVLEKQVKSYAKNPAINVNSPKQLGELLFSELKLGKGKKNRNGFSTSADILEAMEDVHPIIPLILTYRRVQKLYSTYIEGFKPLIEQKTGIIHTSFNQTVTSTGRLSSKEPNLQNIPVRDEEGKELRKFFVPRDGEHVLVGADYSQIELRLLASFSDCQALIKAFKDDVDVHKTTASKVFKVSLDDVTPEMRRTAKAVNFGIIYGISEYGLSKNLKISPAVAKEYISSYFKEYPEVAEYMQKNVEFARENGYSITMLGRRRYIEEILSNNHNLRSFGERAAMNMPLQGSSADIIKLAMIGVHNRLKNENLKSKLILQVHDELIIDALKSEQDRVEKILTEEMENAVNLKVTLTVELGKGETWYDAK